MDKQFYNIQETANQKEMDILFSILNASYHAINIDETVQSILSIIGNHVCVSRVYIFEDLHNNYTRNTYEWCAPGIVPEIQNLQNLCKDDYDYNGIINSPEGKIVNDIKELPQNELEILQPQGIKALAILPLFYHDAPIGYIGYDDCVSTRQWSSLEINLLQSIASIISSLITRRNAEKEVIQSNKILQNISDHLDAAIYVNDPKTFELKFVNHTIATLSGKKPEEIIGKRCWEILQRDMTGPCPFCPIPKLMDENGNFISAVYEWEFKNTVTGNWYLIKDSIVPWTDGNLVHYELSVDISLRKKYEEQLQRFASIDAMTEVYNREWGYKILKQAWEDSKNEKTT